MQTSCYCRVKELRLITIRKFQQSDLLQTANILAVSFGYMFQKLRNVPENKLADLLIKAGIVYPLPFKGYIIATQNREIVGIMMLKWLSQKRRKVKRDISAASKYGFLNVFRLLLGLHLLDSKPKNGYVILNILPSCHQSEVRA